MDNVRSVAKRVADGGWGYMRRQSRGPGSRMTIPLQATQGDSKTLDLVGSEVVKHDMRDLHTDGYADTVPVLHFRGFVREDRG